MQEETTVTEKVQISTIILESILRVVDMDDASKVSCYKKLCETYGLSPSFTEIFENQAMMTNYYKNKKNGNVYKVISRTLVNANNNQKDAMIQILYEDILTGQLYYRNSEEFSEKFVWYRSEDDCEDELED